MYNVILNIENTISNTELYTPNCKLKRLPGISTEGAVFRRQFYKRDSVIRQGGLLSFICDPDHPGPVATYPFWFPWDQGGQPCMA